MLGFVADDLRHAGGFGAGSALLAALDVNMNELVGSQRRSQGKDEEICGLLTPSLTYK
jgi:hypothetical protein